MKISNRDIINMLNAFDEIAQKDLPVELIFKIYDIHSVLLDKYDAYI